MDIDAETFETLAAIIESDPNIPAELLQHAPSAPSHEVVVGKTNIVIRRPTLSSTYKPQDLPLIYYSLNVVGAPETELSRVFVYGVPLGDTIAARKLLAAAVRKLAAEGVSARRTIDVKHGADAN